MRGRNNGPISFPPAAIPAQMMQQGQMPPLIAFNGLPLMNDVQAVAWVAALSGQETAAEAVKWAQEVIAESLATQVQFSILVNEAKIRHAAAMEALKANYEKEQAEAANAAVNDNPTQAPAG